jgi:hypothetical protein
VRRLRVRRLATKFSLAIALLVTTYLALMSIVAVTAGRQSIRDQVLATQRTAATLAARAVEQYVADAVGIMQEAPGRPKLGREIRNVNWAEATKVLENFLQHFRQFDYVAVLDPTGVLRTRVPDAIIGGPGGTITIGSRRDGDTSCSPCPIPGSGPT